MQTASDAAYLYRRVLKDLDIEYMDSV